MQFINTGLFFHFSFGFLLLLAKVYHTYAETATYNCTDLNRFFQTSIAQGWSAILLSREEKFRTVGDFLTSCKCTFSPVISKVILFTPFGLKEKPVSTSLCQYTTITLRLKPVLEWIVYSNCLIQNTK